MKTILTDEEITQVFNETNGASWLSFARAIEAKIIERIGEAVAYYEKNQDLDAWFIAYSHNTNAQVKPLYAIPFIEVGE